MEKWEKDIDGWFGNGAEGDLTRGRFSIKEVKSFIKDLLAKERDGTVKEMVDKIESTYIVIQPRGTIYMVASEVMYVVPKKAFNLT